MVYALLSHTPSCVVSPKEKKRKRKVNINNNLAILPSHDSIGTKAMRTLSIKVKLVSNSMNHLETWNRIKSTMFALNSTVSLLNVNIRLSLRLSLSLVFCSQILMTSTPRPPNKIFNLLIRSNPPQISAIAGILSALGQLKGDCTFQTRLFFPITVWVGIQDGSQANRLSVSENSSTTWWWI